MDVMSSAIEAMNGDDICIATKMTCKNVMSIIGPLKICQPYEPLYGPKFFRLGVGFEPTSLDSSDAWLAVPPRLPSPDLTVSGTLWTRATRLRLVEKE